MQLPVNIANMHKLPSACIYLFTTADMVSDIFNLCDFLSFIFPSGQNRQKNSLKECVFVNLALKIQCHIVKTFYLFLFNLYDSKQILLIKNA